MIDIPTISWICVDPKTEGMCGAFYWKGYVGKWKLFEIHMSMIRGENYDLYGFLPGYKPNLRTNTNEDELKSEAQKILKNWINGLYEVPI